ncbi:AAA family ATPase [Kitasatospora sp. NPDC085879]|uniref:helix-turn-helix transcriptional regulator n=1 Tax=Kitasatospora sp. NPDC085879 TaxID=3154769 RepID=UPI0034354895
MSFRMQGPVRLVGRAPEVAALAGLVQATADGHGGSGVVRGEAGIGKTALLDTLAAQCRRAGLLVLRGAGAKLERRVPFAALHSCLRSRVGAPPCDLDRVSRLLRGEGAAAGSDWDVAISEAFVEVVGQWFATAPGALLLDDLHWVDPSSAAVLGRLLGLLNHLPLLIVAAGRPAPEMAGLLKEFEARGSESWDLGPLTPPAVAELVHDLAGGRPGARLLKRVEPAAGSPLFLTELVAAYERQGDLCVRDGVAEIATGPDGGDGSLPAGSLDEVLVDRFGCFAPQEQDVLEVTALLGAAVTPQDVSTVLGIPLREVLEAVGGAVRSGVLVYNGGRLTFRHELIRQALADRMPSTTRSAVLAHAGHALAAAGTPVERSAQYLLLSDQPLDFRSVDWLDASADALVMRAPELAVDLLERSLQAVQPGDGRTGRLHHQLARALLRGGNPAAAERCARAALYTPRAGEPAAAVGQEAALRWQLALSLLHQGMLDQAVEEAEAAIASDGVGAVEAARFRCFIAQCHGFSGRLDLMAAAAEGALACGRANQDAYSTAFGLYLLAGMRASASHPGQALELIDESLAILGDLDVSPDLPMIPHFVRGFALVELDRFAEARREFVTGLRDCEYGGTVFQVWYHVGMTQLGYYGGRWDDALTEITAGVATNDLLGVGDALRSMQALIGVHRGRAREFADLVEHPDRGFAADIYEFARRWARALVREAAGAPGDALDLLFDSWKYGVREMSQDYLRWLCPDIARLCRRLDRTDLLGHLTAELGRLAARGSTVSIQGTASLARGLLESDPDVLGEAAGAFRMAGQPLAEGYAQEGAAEVLAGAGRTEEAGAALDAALAVYGQLGAVWDADRAKRRLAEAGVRVARPWRVRPTTGWGALSSTEHLVTALVSEGCSDRDIAGRLLVSPRTVTQHLVSVLGKLGLSTRAELAAVARRNGTTVQAPASAPF